MAWTNNLFGHVDGIELEFHPISLYPRDCFRHQYLSIGFVHYAYGALLLPLFPASDFSCDPCLSPMSVIMTHLRLSDHAQQRSSLFCIVEPVLFISLSSLSFLSLSLPSSTFAHSHFIPCQPPLKSPPKPPNPFKDLYCLHLKGIFSPRFALHHSHQLSYRPVTQASHTRQHWLNQEITVPKLCVNMSSSTALLPKDSKKDDHVSRFSRHHCHSTS
jgi:hypothetical protein